MRSTFINCWHLSEEESDAMWRIYSGASEGCIQSTFDRLCESFKETSDGVRIGKISYIDYKADPINSANMYSRYLYKRISFEHEKEIRAIERKYFDEFGGEADVYQWNSRKNDWCSGISITIDVAVIIASVRISTASPKWLSNLVSYVSKSLGYSFEIYQSDLLVAPPLVVNIP